MELSPQTRRFVAEHASDDVRMLALQADRYPEVDLPAAILQIAGKQAAAFKIPSWKEIEGVVYPRSISMEQCSSEQTARYKASLVEGRTLVDLTGGFGIDCAFLAPRFERVTYVERQEELCCVAAHNFPLLGLSSITVCHGESEAFLKEMSPVDWIFIDPARRNERGGKTVAIGDCEPNVASLEEALLEKAANVLVKLSPMLDLAQAMRELRCVREVHVVSVQNECKELLLVLGKAAVGEVGIHCVNLTSKGEQRFTFTREQERANECSYASQLRRFLYEPNASILKAGAFRSVASAFGLQKLHPNSHLYTSDRQVEAFPGRVFRIVTQCGFNKKELKEKLPDLKKANLTVRNFPASVAELRKRMKLSEGGDQYLFATTLSDERKVVLCCQKA